MSATLSADRFGDNASVVERKLDGARCLAFRDGEQMRLLSRNEKPMDRTYPEVADCLSAQAVSRFVLDGEIVAFEGRRSSFAKLQGRLGVQDERAPPTARPRQTHARRVRASIHFSARRPTQHDHSQQVT